jgi:hypothetical protein
MDISEPIYTETDDGAPFGSITCQWSPELCVYEPEIWRFLRLSRVLGAAKTIAHIRLGDGAKDDLQEAISCISDCEGEFHVTWKDPVRRSRYEQILEEALLIENENYMTHADFEEDEE